MIIFIEKEIKTNTRPLLKMGNWLLE